jgi:hypothetical protein
MQEYDKEKFVVLVSAGPSARHVEYSENYYTAGVNVTPNFLETTNFWVVNDGCYFNDFSREKLSTIENLALPEFPHTVNGINYQPDRNLNYKKVTAHLPENINLIPFNIHTSRKFQLPADPQLPYFEVKSSNESAVRILLHLGFRKFISLGQDPGGNYHKEMFSRPTSAGGHKKLTEPLDNNRYTNVQSRIKDIIREQDALMIRLVIPENESFNDDKFTLFSGLVNRKGYYEVEKR